MKKSTFKIIAAIGGVAAANLAGLAAVGKKFSIGPFSHLHSWQPDVDKIIAKYGTDRKNEILFYGASNFALWTQLDEDLGEYKVQNHAFGGSTDKDLMQYADQLLYPYEPAVVFFQTGSNDYVQISGTDEEKVRKCMEFKRQMFEKFHEELPDAKFVIMSGLLLPGRSQYLELTLTINEELKKFAEEKDYLYFVDANAMTYDGSSFDETLFRNDGIHLNRDGQMLWYCNYIHPMLKEIILEHHLGNLWR